MRLLLASIVITSLTAADWYVAPGGSDAAAGTEAAPLATLAAAITSSGSGDRILLARGGTWRESGITIPAGRTLTSYGSGNDPVITGTTVRPMTGTWGTNSEVKTAAQATQVLACWVNGVFIPLARHPNSVWLTTDTGTTKDRIVDPGSGVQYNRWTGAQVRWRRGSRFWETRPIIADDGVGNLDLSATNRTDDNNTGIGSYYFIDNTLAALDAQNEWYWAGGTLYLYPPSGVDTATMTVEVATATSTITAHGATVSGIAFRRWATTPLTVGSASTISSCTFADLDANAIEITTNAGNTTVSGNTFTDIHNVGVLWNSSPTGTGGGFINDNRFERIGMLPGYGGSGTGHAAAIIASSAKQLTITRNRIADVGYCGIIIGTAGQTVSRNVLVRCLSTLNDGAAISTTCGSTTISENIILDTIGDLSMSFPAQPAGHGIWPDFQGNYTNNVISGNTISGSNGNGIFLRNNYQGTISDNVCIDNRTAALFLSEQDTTTASTSQNHSITGNVLAVVNPTRRIARNENLQDPGSVAPPSSLTYELNIDYGSMSGTRFAASSESSLIRTTLDTYQPLVAWKDINASWADANATPALGHPFLLINDTTNTVAIPVPAGTWMAVDGSSVGSTVTVAPFRSVVLVRTTAPPDTPPYTTASGRDYRATSPWSSGNTLAAPVVTAHPANTTAAVGSTATFAVAATGNPVPSYQWQLLSGTWTDIAGATASTYTTATLIISDSGRSYRCRLTNSQGSVSTNTATLTVSNGSDPNNPEDPAAGGGCGAGALAALLLLARLRRR